MAALFERERSGRGQKVSVNLFDTALALQTLESSTLLAYQRETNWVSDWYSGIFETTDGLLLVLGLFRENALGLACKALGIDDLSVQPTFATPQLQAENKEAANAVLRPLVAQLSTAEAAELFDGSICCAHRCSPCKKRSIIPRRGTTARSSTSRSRVCAPPG